MTLLEHLKTHRARQKGKNPLPETVFAVVASLVQQFALTSIPPGESPRDRKVQTPRAARLSLFPLLSPVQFRLAQEIIARFDNPYLIYARSPEDVTISLLLYQSNPHLPAETLQEYSLGALWAGEASPELGKRVELKSFEPETEN
jgi:hypothetical protein